MAEAGSNQDYQLYVAARRIGEIYFEEINSAWIMGSEIRATHTSAGDSFNPYYHQTEQGLFIDFYYGNPSRVWTPWGEYQFNGGTNSDIYSQRVVTESFLKRLGVTLHRPETNDPIGVLGPTYAVLRVGEIELPEARLKSGKPYIPREVAYKVLARFNRRYNQELNRDLTH